MEIFLFLRNACGPFPACVSTWKVSYSILLWLWKPLSSPAVFPDATDSFKMGKEAARSYFCDTNLSSMTLINWFAKKASSQPGSMLSKINVNGWLNLLWFKCLCMGIHLGAKWEGGIISIRYLIPCWTLSSFRAIVLINLSTQHLTQYRTVHRNS